MREMALKPGDGHAAASHTQASDPQIREPGDGPSHKWAIRGFSFSRLLERLLSSNRPAWFNARGVGFGLAIGFACPMGSQFFVVALLRLITQFNSVAALAVSMVANPLTFVPLYYGYYLAGSYVLGEQSVMNMESFTDIVTSAADAGYFYESLVAFVVYGKSILARWCIGAAITSTFFGVAGYVVTYRYLRRRSGRLRTPS